jgi:4-amino-4-deoxy-L-arabinose transferase-like glycosyltransferase
MTTQALTESLATAVPGKGGTRAERWVHGALGAVLLLSVGLYTWGLDRNGYGNDYYAAAVLAGTRSWKTFFFGSFDAGNFITVDKPPAALWLMELSGRLFGVNPWSLLLPEALLGVATVALLFFTVRRLAGPVAGLVAALTLALTPVATLMFRFDNPDALLTFLLVASAWGLVRGLETGRTRWLLASAGLVGLAFTTKYLQAFLVLPALAFTYLLLGPRTWPRRLGQLLAAGGALVLASGWWVTAVELIPANARPFIGGSTNNSVLNLVLGYDGFGRLVGALGLGRGPGVGGGGGFGGQPGFLRLFNDQFGGEISWLLPLAGLALVAGLWAHRRAPRTDLVRAGYVLWGLWTVTHAAVFSFASGIVHSYYAIAMAPGVAGLVGMGMVDLWRLRSRSLLGGALAAGSLLLTAWWGAQLLVRTPDFAPGLGAAEVGLTIVAALLLLLPEASRRPAPALALGLVAVLLGPAAYAVATADRVEQGSAPSSGPVSLVAPGLGFGGRGFGVPAGGPGGANSSLLAYLEQHQGTATWLVAVGSATQGAPIELATGRPVLAMGGFSGSDPALSVARLKQLLASGQLRYVLAGGGRGGFGGLPGMGPPGLRASFPSAVPAFGGPRPTVAGAGDETGSVMAWVVQHCREVELSSSGVSGLYDCSAAAPSGS